MGENSKRGAYQNFGSLISRSFFAALIGGAGRVLVSRGAKLPCKILRRDKLFSPQNQFFNKNFTEGPVALIAGRGRGSCNTHKAPLNKPFRGLHGSFWRLEPP